MKNIIQTHLIGRLGDHQDFINEVKKALVSIQDKGNSFQVHYSTCSNGIDVRHDALILEFDSQ